MSKIYKGETEVRWRWSRMWWDQGAWCFHYDWKSFDDQFKWQDPTGGYFNSQWKWIWKSDWKKWNL